MFCTNCGKEMDDKAMFCVGCGVATPNMQKSSERSIMNNNSTSMKCPKCGNGNISVQAITDTHTEHRGCLGWCIWLLLAVFTFGLILIIPLLTNSKTKSKTHTEAICQNCGYRWRV